MGYAVYQVHGRWAGYGVPAQCDMPGCQQMIDRGLDYKCEPYEGYVYYSEGLEVSEDEDWDEELPQVQRGCGLFFCAEHSYHPGHEHATPKPDVPEWNQHLLTDPSWQDWRTSEPEACARLRSTVLAERYVPAEGTAGP